MDANAIFDCFHVAYSPVGSNARLLEEATTMWFIEFLGRCAMGGKIIIFFIFSVENYEDLHYLSECILA